MKKIYSFLFAICTFCASAGAQITECPSPSEWDQLVEGARFIDRFLPMPDGIKSNHLWGT